MKAVKSRRNHDSRTYHPYRISPPNSGGRPKADQLALALQEQNRLQQEQLQQQARLAQAGFRAPAGAGPASGAAVPAADGNLMNMPSYADQMHAAFLDYQRQRVEFEQQQQQLLQKLYNNYPDVSGAQPPVQVPVPVPVPGLTQAPQQQPAKTASGFPYQRQQFSSNGLQPGGPAVPAGRPGPQPALGAGDFYSTQQHMGFMQQQHQDVLREQQQLVAQHFATSQIAPTTRQSFGMAVPMSSVLSTPMFPSTADAAHMSFPGGDPNHSF